VTAASPVLAIVGPTATGKSALALELAVRLGGELVSADAFQVYRGLDIGTAKPTPEERARVPHHLVDFKDPREGYSAGEYARDARAAISDAAGRGRLPIVVGGCGLYVRAALDGLMAEPLRDPVLRGRLEADWEESGGDVLLARLAEVDPETAGKLSPRQRDRILRALEISLLSGRPASLVRRQAGHLPSLPTVYIGLAAPRQELYARIEARVDRFFEAGLVGEVEGLLASGVPPEAPAMRAIGYRQVAGHLMGAHSLAEAVRLTKRDTRRYAKRQETWWRGDCRVEWFAAGSEGLAEVVDKWLEKRAVGL